MPLPPTLLAPATLESVTLLLAPVTAVSFGFTAAIEVSLDEQTQTFFSSHFPSE